MLCADGSLYTGICTNLLRRLHEHNHSDKLGARYTRTRRPVIVVYQESAPSRSIASQREHQIQSMTRVQKVALINAAGQLPEALVC